MNPKDQTTVEKIRDWLESRASERVAWKRISSLMSAFSAKRWTSSLKLRMNSAFSEFGILADPPLETLGPKDTVYLSLRKLAESLDDPQEDDGFAEESDVLPNQIAAWHQQNIGDDDPDDHEFRGQYLQCLKATAKGDRQFVWEGTSGRGIVGVVTYGEPLIQEGNRYARWGRCQLFPKPIPPEKLLSHPATSNRFGKNGIRALQGGPIRLAEQEAKAISKLVGGLKRTRLPMDEPADWENLGHWTGKDGLAAETIAENAICTLPHLQRALGLRGTAEKQVRLGAGRADIVCGNVIIELKRAVTTNNGPDQIEGYLEHVSAERKTGKKNLRGILVQQSKFAGAGMKQRLANSPFRLELWAVFENQEGEWETTQLLGKNP